MFNDYITEKEDEFPSVEEFTEMRDEMLVLIAGAKARINKMLDMLDELHLNEEDIFCDKIT